MNLTLVTLFTAISFIVYGYSSFISRRMKSEYARWGYNNQRKLVGSLQLLGGVGLLMGLKIDILLNGEKVDALNFMVHKSKADFKAREIVKSLREVIPRQMYDVAIQGAIGSKILARETVKAYRKDVTAKLYGGDVTRKKKLLEKQKKGKKKMRQIGKVEVPQEAFLSVLRVTK